MNKEKYKKICELIKKRDVILDSKGNVLNNMIVFGDKQQEVLKEIFKILLEVE